MLRAACSAPSTFIAELKRSAKNMHKEIIKMRKDRGPWSSYAVTYFDDSPQRVEAVSFFSSKKNRLLPHLILPEEINLMSVEEGQQYLDSHPMKKEWYILDISDGFATTCSDEELGLIVHIPELKIVKILTDKITDTGIRHLSCLSAPESICVYSRSVTDRCLDYFSGLKTLKALDFQRSPNVSRDAYFSVISTLPLIESPYPPPK